MLQGVFLMSVKYVTETVIVQIVTNEIQFVNQQVL